MIYFFIKNMVATHWILLELLQAVKQEYSFFHSYLYQVTSLSDLKYELLLKVKWKHF